MLRACRAVTVLVYSRRGKWAAHYTGSEGLLQLTSRYALAIMWKAPLFLNLQAIGKPIGVPSTDFSVSVLDFYARIILASPIGVAAFLSVYVCVSLTLTLLRVARCVLCSVLCCTHRDVLVIARTEESPAEMSRGFQRDVGSRLRTTSMAENSGNRPSPSATGMRVTRECDSHCSMLSVGRDHMYNCVRRPCCTTSLTYSQTSTNRLVEELISLIELGVMCALCVLVSQASCEQGEVVQSESESSLSGVSTPFQPLGHNTSALHVVVTSNCCVFCLSLQNKTGAG